MNGAATHSSCTVAVLADIHGNLAALRAVLADLAHQSYDRLVIAGDLARSGPRPAETIDVLRALEATIVYGNADRDVVNPKSDEPATQWVQRALGPERLTWLATLPFDCRITPPGESHPQTTC